MAEALETVLWTFIRTDLSVADFEAWLYTQDPMDELLGAVLAFDLMATDYRDRNAVYLIRQRLEKRLRPMLSCECVTLPDLASVPMGADGRDGRVFATQEPIGEDSDRPWWLHAYRCKACGEAWLAAHEERIYDEYLFRRLSETEVRAVEQGRWPDDFLTYESVLKTCAKLGRPWRWDDPLAASLRYTVEDLRAARPDISPEEIAACMGIEVDHARLLLSRIGLP